MKIFDQITVTCFVVASALATTGCSNDDVIGEGSKTDDNAQVEFKTDIPALESWICDDGEQQIAGKLADFSFRLFSASAKDPQSCVKSGNMHNLNISPLSVVLNMQLVVNSVDDVAAKSILDMLGVGGKEQFNKYVNKLIRNLVAKQEMAIGNSVWYNTGYFKSVSSDYADMMSESSYACVKGINFGQSGSLDVMNNWVKDATLGFIDEMFTEDMLQNSNLWLLNTLFYAARWTDPFDAQNTHRADFRNYLGEKRKVDMMHNELIAAYGETKDYSYVTLPTATSIVTFMLPKKGTTVETLAQEMTLEKLLHPKSVIATDNVIFNVNLSIPKFEISADLSLAGTLQSLGMQGLVLPDKMGLTPELPSKMNIEVMQKLYTSIDETGVKVASSTATGIYDGVNGGGKKPKVVNVDFTLDRPFVYVISHINTGSIIMSGYVNDMP